MHVCTCTPRCIGLLHYFLSPTGAEKSWRDNRYSCVDCGPSCYFLPSEESSYDAQNCAWSMSALKMRMHAHIHKHRHTRARAHPQSYRQRPHVDITTDAIWARHTTACDVVCTDGEELLVCPCGSTFCGSCFRREQSGGSATVQRLFSDALPLVPHAGAAGVVATLGLLAEHRRRWHPPPTADTPLLSALCARLCHPSVSPRPSVARPKAL